MQLAKTVGSILCVTNLFAISSYEWFTCIKTLWPFALLHPHFVFYMCQQVNIFFRFFEKFPQKIFSEPNFNMFLCSFCLFAGAIDLFSAQNSKKLKLHDVSHDNANNFTWPFKNFWYLYDIMIKHVKEIRIKKYCIVLYCIVLYCILLYCIVLYCIVLYCIVLYMVLYCILYVSCYNSGFTRFYRGIYRGISKTNQTLRIMKCDG